MSPGLYIVATPIGHMGDITLRALVCLSQADAVACEDTRLSGILLARYGIKTHLISLHDHNEEKRLTEILERIKKGEAVALISDAGMPLIADPGYKLAREIRKAGHQVTVLPGANAALTALAGSGLPTDQFHFVGFLKPKSVARQKEIASLAHIPGTLIFYEAPQRLGGMLEDLATHLGAERQAAVARELTKLFEETTTGTLGELRDIFGETPPKGEIIVLLGPRPPTAHAESDIEALLKTALRKETLRDAVMAVSAITGVKKGDVYAKALKLVGKS